MDNVGVRAKRREKKHFDAHQDTRCVWEALGSEGPSRATSRSASPCASPLPPAGRPLNVGYYEFHSLQSLGRQKRPRFGGQPSQVWQCMGRKARSLSPQDGPGHRGGVRLHQTALAHQPLRAGAAPTGVAGAAFRSQPTHPAQPVGERPWPGLRAGARLPSRFGYYAAARRTPQCEECEHTHQRESSATT
ncbi:unnamed protein product [Effrenium voratum]|uniref:Uncharacterized protein n=1 Tax=Effrenium voratum TaxID=2562239 RepID=A0AA36MN52_9DINO|nr:unnamed protein product [Effrenium voratum]